MEQMVESMARNVVLKKDIVELVDKWPKAKKTKFSKDVKKYYQDCHAYLVECSMSWMDGLKELNWVDLKSPLNNDLVIESLSFLEV